MSPNGQEIARWLFIIFAVVLGVFIFHEMHREAAVSAAKSPVSTISSADCDPKSPSWVQCLEAGARGSAVPLRAPELPKPNPEEQRVSRMSQLLGSGSTNSYDEYEKLCSQATTEPVVGMTVLQARATTWCFPCERHKTTTASGTRVQEVYAISLLAGCSGYRHRYLYFENGILTAIQD